ncbi:LysR family transcriptional regulator [Mycobacterium sp. ITM-2016-00317]|uniref:LysR family transcriptional regulator n=1 Tax=Mycobacterium sp. ITM-2016-00317 TaxID=2099694 RepID=UPI0037C7495E
MFARTEHFGHAATDLGVSVATVQRAVRSLERKLGVSLVEQSGRRVRMLPAGRVFEREAHAVLRGRQDAISNTRADAGHTSLVRIAHTHSLGLGFVPGVLAELLESVPGVRFRCWQGTATDVIAALLRGEADIGFTSVAPSERDFVVEPLFTEALLLAVPADDPLASAGSASLEDVRDRPFVAMELGASSRASMVSACARAGFVPRIVAEGNDLFVVESMVGAGIGVSLVPQGMTDHQHARVVRLPIAHPLVPDRTILLVYPLAGVQYANVQLLSKIALLRARTRQESFQKLQ